MLNCILDSLVCNGEVSEAVALARLDVLFKYYFDVIGMILLIKKSVLGEEPVGCADSLDGLARLPPTTLFGRGRQADDIVRAAPRACWACSSQAVSFCDR